MPLECVLRQEEQRIVIEIVDELPARQREAVMLHYYQGLSVTEIADVMEIAQQGVSAYLKYARDKVRTGIERRAHKEPGGQIRVLSMLPIGPLMAQAFSQEATLAGVSGNLWTQNTTELCIKNLAGKSSGTPAAANTSATSFFKPVAPSNAAFR